MSEKVFSFLKNNILECTVFNVYGPTETSIWSTASIVSESEKLHLGK